MATCLSTCEDTMGTVIAATQSAVSATNNIKTRKSSDEVLFWEHNIQNVRKRNSDNDTYQSPSKHLKVEHTIRSTNDTTNNNMVINIGESQSHFNIPLKKYEDITADLEISDNTDSDENDDVNMRTFEETLQSIDNTYKQQEKLKRKKVKEQNRSKKQSLDDKSHEIKEIQSEFSLHLANFVSQKMEKARQENLNQMMEIKKCKEREKKLLREKSMLEEKMKKEREEFVAQLNLVNLSKQDMEKKLNAKIREHQALELAHQEMEKMKQAKEMTKEKEDMEAKLNEAQFLCTRYQSDIAETNIIIERERREKVSLMEQEEQSREEIASLRQQLDQVKNEVQSLESDRHMLLDNQYEQAIASRHSVLSELGLIMESELQCSICVEMFVSPVVLNCSHTFCKFCINTHMRRNMECPLCRVRIVSQCKNLILETFVEKMVASWTEEMKEKRREFLQTRAEEMAALNLENRRQQLPDSGLFGDTRRRLAPNPVEPVNLRLSINRAVDGSRIIPAMPTNRYTYNMDP